MNILLGVTASVAATLTTKLCKQLKELGNVKVVLTNNSLHFVDYFSVESLFENCQTQSLGDFSKDIFTDNDEWSFGQYKKSTDILHIRLREWADVLLIAPLTANTLAKISNGICDNLLTSIFCAWDDKKSIILAPAMNTHMWENKCTDYNVDKLNRLYSGDTLTCFFSEDVVEKCRLYWLMPVNKKLACGDIGVGAMAPINLIIKTIKKIKCKKQI